MTRFHLLSALILVAAGACGPTNPRADYCPFAHCVAIGGSAQMCMGVCGEGEPAPKDGQGGGDE